MKSIETLEAELWLAQRAHRRNPSEENQSAVEAIEAEIEKLNTDSSGNNPSNDPVEKKQKAEDKPKKETKSKEASKKKEEQPT